MGGSATLYSDQVSVAMCDEVIGDNLIGVLHGRGEEHDDGEGCGDDHAAEGEGQACVERDPQEELFDELVPEIQRVGSSPHKRRQDIGNL